MSNGFVWSEKFEYIDGDGLVWTFGGMDEGFKTGEPSVKVVRPSGDWKWVYRDGRCFAHKSNHRDIVATRLKGEAMTEPNQPVPQWCEDAADEIARIVPDEVNSLQLADIIARHAPQPQPASEPADALAAHSEEIGLYEATHKSELTPGDKAALPKPTGVIVRSFKENDVDVLYVRYDDYERTVSRLLKGIIPEREQTSEKSMKSNDANAKSSAYIPEREQGPTQRKVERYDGGSRFNGAIVTAADYDRVVAQKDAEIAELMCEIKDLQATNDDQGDALIAANRRAEAAEAEFAKLEAILESSCEDVAEDDTAIREMLRPYLTPYEVDGDSWSVPSIPTVVESFVNVFRATQAKLAAAERATSVMKNALVQIGSYFCKPSMFSFMSRDAATAFGKAIGDALNGKLYIGKTKYRANKIAICNVINTALATAEQEKKTIPEREQTSEPADELARQSEEIGLYEATQRPYACDEHNGSYLDEPTTQTPSREWISKMADHEDKHPSVSVRNPDTIEPTQRGVESYATPELMQKTADILRGFNPLNVPMGPWMPQSDHDRICREKDAEIDFHQSSTQILAHERKMHAEAIALRDAEIAELKRRYAMLSQDSSERLAEANQRAERAEAERDRKHELLAALCSDNAEEDTAIRDALRPYLSADAIDGDSYGVPSLTTVVQCFVAEFQSLQAQLAAANDRAKELEKRISEGGGA